MKILKDPFILKFITFQGPYEYGEIALLQSEIPSFIPIDDKFKLTATCKGKMNNKLHIITQVTVDYELKEVD